MIRGIRSLPSFLVCQPINELAPMTITRRKLLQKASVLAGATGLSFTNPSTDNGDKGQELRTTPDSTVDPIELLDFEPLARKRITPVAWEYISSGAGDELSLRWNRE